MKNTMTLGEQIRAFIERTGELLGDPGERGTGYCDHSLEIAFRAASETDLPAWVLESGRFCCTCEFLLNQKNFFLTLLDLCVERGMDSEGDEVRGLIEAICVESLERWADDDAALGVAGDRIMLDAVRKSVAEEVEFLRARCSTDPDALPRYFALAELRADALCAEEQ
jgi:hypothetical protein